MDSDSWKDISRVQVVPGGKPGEFSKTDSPSRILPSIPPPPGAGARIYGLRVLIIDNDPAKLDVLSTDLRRLGATVAVGDQGESGFYQAVRSMPDVVISDLVSPGATGWRLIDRLRHHPLLLWTPILLLRWWETTASGDGRVLLDRLVDRVEEVLAPRRVIEDRIAAEQPLGERIEHIGMPVLLRLLASARLDGLLTVNDAWSVFEVRIKGDRLQQIHRNGVDGSTDEGIQALTQLLLCDVGRWTFRASASVVTGKHWLSVDESLKQAGQNLSLLFGQGALLDNGVIGRLRVEEDALLEAATTMGVSARSIADAIIKGQSEADLENLASGNDNLTEIDRVLKILIRCGAICLDKEASKKAKGRNESVRVIVFLTNKLNGRWVEPPSSENKTQAMGIGLGLAPHRSSETRSLAGAYSVSDVASERVGQVRTVLPQLTQETVDLEYSEQGHPDSEDTSPVLTTQPETVPLEGPDGHGVHQLQKTEPGDLLGGFRRIIHDSLVPGPAEHSSEGRGQMVFALVLALLLGALLVAGVVLLAGSDRKPTIPVTDQSQVPEKP